jgi:hypothetical protein
MCQTEAITQNVVRLSKQSYSHRLEIVMPNAYHVTQLARLNRELDQLYEMIYDDWQSISEEDYKVFGTQLTILLQTIKQLYHTCKEQPKEMGLKEETKKLGMNYSALFELNSDIVSFCINMPKNKEMKQLMERLTKVDDHIKRTA